MLALLALVLGLQTCDDVAAMLSSALELRSEARLEAATLRFEDARMCHPGDRGVALELAMTYAWQQRFDDALALYAEHLQTQPDDVAALLGRGRVLSWAGRRDEAARLYDRLLSADSVNVEALNGRAFVAAAEWRLSTARALYERALRIAPENEEAAAGLKRLRDTSRLSSQIRLGGLMITDGRRVIGNRASLSYRLGPRSTVNGGVSTSTRLDSDAVHEQRVSAGIVREVGTRWTVSATTAVSRGDTGLDARTGLSVSRRTGSRLVMMASAQAAPDALRRGGQLVSGGLVYSLGRAGYAILQRYRFFETGSTGSSSTVVGLSLRHGRFSLAPNLTHFRRGSVSRTDYAVSAGVGVRDIRVGLQAGGSAQDPKPKFGLMLAIR